MTTTVVTPWSKESNCDYEIHPLAKLFPPPDEFKKLKEDIRTHGQRDPIMLSADGKSLGTVVEHLDEATHESRTIDFPGM